MNHLSNLKAALLLLPLALTACDNNSDNNTEFKDAAVVATRTTGAGAVSLVDVNAPYTAQNNLSPSATNDIVVRSGGDHYFVFRRFETNQISRYDIANPNTPVYTYSTEATSGEQSNPYDLIIVNASKAYLLRYGSSKLWVVNPSATREADFKIDEIDLSAYDGFDQVPEMAAGIYKDGKLYVALQRLESFAAVKSSYVAVIDVATNKEIDTKPNEAGLKGIELPVRNVGNPFGVGGLIALPGSNKILAVAAGGYNSEDFSPEFNGGVAAIDTTNYSASLLLDDGTPADHPYGQFIDLTIAAADRAYLITTAPYPGPQTLYRFNPSAASPTPVVVTGFESLPLSTMAIDPNGKLWVGLINNAAPGVAILGFANGADVVEKDRVNTSLVPINIDFVTVPVN